MSELEYPTYESSEGSAGGTPARVYVVNNTFWTDWVNPNAFFFVDVKQATGTITNWAIQFGNPLELERNGWKRSALHIGDAVTIEGTPARGVTRQASARNVRVGDRRKAARCGAVREAG